MNEEIVIAVTLISEIHKVAKYQVRYMGLIYNVTKVSSVSGDTFNYVEQEIERIPEQVLDFVESWLQDKF